MGCANKGLQINRSPDLLRLERITDKISILSINQVSLLLDPILSLIERIASLRRKRCLRRQPSGTKYRQ